GHRLRACLGVLPRRTAMRAFPPGRTILTLMVALMPSIPMHADEGMWLLNAPPRQLLEQRYRFTLTDDWLQRAMHASVRLNNGGSGGFVSASGLIVTNHHVGSELIQKVTPQGKDYLRDGYLASTRKQELRCPDLEINILQEI